MNIKEKIKHQITENVPYILICLQFDSNLESLHENPEILDVIMEYLEAYKEQCKDFEIMYNFNGDDLTPFIVLKIILHDSYADSELDTFGKLLIKHLC